MQMLSKFFIAAFSCAVCVSGAQISIAQPPFPKNSTQKNRVEPRPIAARIGSSVNWETNFETAKQKSAESGKPIFWYVPTLRGSFMDRLDSVDRYMMAGPFSWPDIISLLNKHTVPLKAQPNVRQQREFELRPYVFIEPGFLILTIEGQESFRIDRLTTLHPVWFRQLLINALSLKQPDLPANQSLALSEAWKLFREGRYEEFQFDEAQLNATSNESGHAGEVTVPPLEITELLLLAGMFDFRLGRHDAAKEKWKRASLIDPTHPLAAKAAAEAEGFGPFVRGFETHRDLPPAALAIRRPTQGSLAPESVYDENAIWKRSTEFLLGMQNENGAFTDSDYDFGGTDSLPNVHVAVTAIAGMALLRSRDYFPGDDEFGRRVDAAIRRVAAYIANDLNLNFDDRDELAWAMIYRIEFLSELLKRHLDQNGLEKNGVAEQGVEVRQRLGAMVRQLELLQTESGNWFHEYNNSFVTASALLALESAQSCGAAVSADVLQKGAMALARDRFQIGAFPYSSDGQPSGVGTPQKIAESAGRMPLCELALWKLGKSDDTRLARAIEHSLKHHRHLTSALKYDDHTSNMSYGGFFFWYDVRGRCAAIQHLANAEMRRTWKRSQRDLILALPEIDGCFVDSHELGRVYGTSMALLSLADSAAEEK